jgi:hypothetical protein
MKKSKFLVVGLIGLLLAVGLVLAGCGDADNGGNNNGGNNNGGDPNNGGNENQGGNNPGGTQVPGYVQGLEVTAQSSSSIKITWTVLSGATGYELYCEKNGDGSSPSAVATRIGGTITATSYTHTGLPASTSYRYWIRGVNSAGSGGYNARNAKTDWGGGSLTVTGYRQGVNSTIGIFVLTSNPSTFDDFNTARNSAVAQLVANPTSNDKYDWEGGYSAPPDGTYTIVISTGGIGFSLSSTQVYKFTNITISGGSATVPFNTVLGAIVGTNGRLK